MQESVIVQQISFLAVLILIGLVASKIGVIKAETRDTLAKIIFNITLPLLLLTNFSKLDFSHEILRNSLYIIIISLAVILFMVFIGIISSGFFKMKHAQRSVFIAHHGFGNVLYFGFPVVNALYGELGLFYASIYTFVSIMLLWTVGVYLISRNRQMSLRESIKKMINPNSVAIILGFTLFLLKVNIPDIILEPFVSLGGTTIYLSMLYIGALLGLMNVKGVLTNRLVYFTSANKNLLLPLLLILAFSFFKKNILTGLDPLILSVVIIEAAMPCMANVVIVAKIFKVDEQLAAANVFMSTTLSLLSLPLVWWVMNLLI